MSSITFSCSRLYSNGCDVNLPAIYPDVSFPVSLGTPMIAPNIKWDHSDDWFVTNFSKNLTEKSAERKVKISLTDPEYEYILGHSIDGNLMSSH